MGFTPWVPVAGNVTLPLPIVDGGTGAITQQLALDALAGAVTSATYLRGNGTHVALAALAAADVQAVQNWAGVFGDGSDAAAVLDGVATVTWATLAGSTYTMTVDCMCTSLTVNAGIILKMSGQRIFAQGAVANAGTISSNGNSTTTAAAGANSGSFATSPGSAGGAGALTGGAAGTAGAGLGGTGGAGGTTGGNAGGAGGGAPAGAVVAAHTARTPFMAAGPCTYNGNNGNRLFSGGTGGGGGGGDGANSGGGGGGGAGAIVILAASMVNTGTISAVGGNGANGAGGNASGGGGGGGGVILVYTKAAWTAGSTTVAGGTHGTKAGTGSDGTDGSAGTVLNVLVT